MYNLVTILHLNPGLNEKEKHSLAADMSAKARALPGAQAILFAPTLPDVYYGGDFIWRCQFADNAAYEAARTSDIWRAGLAPQLGGAAIAAIDQAAFATGQSGGTSNGKGVYRVALFCANRNPTIDRLRQFADDTAAMPKSVKTIRCWQLSTADRAEGARPWTHIWEQEYDTLSGLMGAYMMHPCHWSHVDRWFDPEYPEWLVDTRLCHTFCEFDKPVLV